ncbi:unnamed protein product [Natator depressus]
MGCLMGEGLSELGVPQLPPFYPRKEQILLPPTCPSQNGLAPLALSGGVWVGAEGWEQKPHTGCTMCGCLGISFLIHSCPSPSSPPNHSPTHKGMHLMGTRPWVDIHLPAHQKLGLPAPFDLITAG